MFNKKIYKFGALYNYTNREGKRKKRANVDNINQRINIDNKYYCQ